MRRSGFLPLAALLLAAAPGEARLERALCGTYRERGQEQVFLHRQAEKARRAAGARAALSAAPRSAAADAGNIVVLDDSGGVVATRNLFDLDQKTLRFQPANTAASAYTFQVSGASYDAAAAASPSVVAMQDDDSHSVALPFPFPFFGVNYQSIFINSDGNLTFVAGDASFSERSLGRVVAGPPRIAPLFEDLDPSRTPLGIHVASSPSRFAVSWVRVPEYADFGGGTPQTFQVRLFPDGTIEFAWAGVLTAGAVVGIAPGNLQGSSSVVSFVAGSGSQYTAAIAERFGGSIEVDTVTAVQKFYETHQDSYDYIVLFNNLGVPASAGSLAFEETVRNVNRSGYGDIPMDAGKEYGSAARLQAILNMGPLSQYPADPAQIATIRAPSPYSGLALIAHETGHLFLAYASVSNPGDPLAQPMLGLEHAHWSFTFNAEASFMEGNRIQDKGSGVIPRFVTTDAVDTYSPLDQYLMGFRAPAEVPPTFLVTNSLLSPTRLPAVGVAFGGDRRDITVDDLIQAAGRRIPDSTVAQRRFRFAFVLIVAAGTTPSLDQLDQLEAYRSRFEAYYATSSSQRAAADATLKRALHFSLFPAAGVLQGRTGTATLTTQTPVPAPLAVSLLVQTGLVTAPSSVTIPAGATSVSFTVAGLQPGADQITATPVDATYETAVAKIQVAAPAAVELNLVSGDRQISSPALPLAMPIVLRVRDANLLPYPGLRVQATPSSGGSVSPGTAVADAAGTVTFQWTPGGGASLALQVFIEGTSPASGVTITALPPGAVDILAVTNAASGAAGLAPGMLSSIYGANLAGGANGAAPFPWPISFSGVSVAVNGAAVPVLFVRDDQINFLAPPNLPAGTANVTITTAHGTSAAFAAAVADVIPGIFVLANSSFGAILNTNTTQTTADVPATRGQPIDIYCTGLGAVVPSSAPGLFQTVVTPQVFIGSQAQSVTFSGLSPAYQMGLYLVRVQLSSNTPTGLQGLTLATNGIFSNGVLLLVQ